MPLNYAPGDEAVAASTDCARWPSGGTRSRQHRHRHAYRERHEAEWRETVRFWKSCGVTHLTLGTYSGRGHLRRIDGRTLTDHLAALKRYWNPVVDLL